MNYYIQTTMGPKGNYKIHKVGCKQVPMTSNRFYLGNLFNAIHAIAAAKASGYNLIKICACCTSRSAR